MIEGGEVDLCPVDPGFEVDLYIRSSLRSMTAVWIGASSLKSELEAHRITLTGNKAIAGAVQRWLGRHVLAQEETRRAG